MLKGSDFMENFISKNPPPTEDQISGFLKVIDFNPPQDFIEFIKTSNGAGVYINESYLSIWTLDQMLDLTNKYQENEDFGLPSSYFIIGSDGGSGYYLMDKVSYIIYEIEPLDMHDEEPTFKAQNFTELLRRG